MKKLVFIILLLIGIIKVQANCATGSVASPIVDSISVDFAGNVTICWQALPDPDVVTYAIFTINPFTGSYDSITSVAAPTTCFTMPAALNGSDTSSVQYSIRAYDNCVPLPNASPLGGANFHGTIYLQKAEFPCTASITLSWTPYDDFTSGTNVLYNVYVSENAGPFIIAGTVASPATSFNYVGVNQGSNYVFYIGVIENGGAGPFTSSSNDVSVNGLTFLIQPNPSYLYTATVVDSQQIDVSFFVDTAADISYYDIKRAVNPAGPYSSVGSVNAFSGMNPYLQFSDINDVNANATYYFYVVEAINICGNSSDTSNIGRTVWLKAKSDGINATNTLTITQYENWLGNVQSYDIYRAVAGVWESTPFASIGAFGDTITFVDDITTVFYGDGEYCYKIIANEGAVVHQLGFPPATSISNESCVFHEPLIYVPNAFIPGSSYNSEFRPILTFADPNSYLLQIYNKWGQKIFETGNVLEGWNGAMNNSGSMCQVDSYVYVVQFESSTGQEFSKRGVISLIR